MLTLEALRCESNLRNVCLKSIPQAQIMVNGAVVRGSMYTIVVVVVGMLAMEAMMVMWCRICVVFKVVVFTTVVVVLAVVLVKVLVVVCVHGIGDSHGRAHALSLARVDVARSGSFFTVSRLRRCRCGAPVELMT